MQKQIKKQVRLHQEKDGFVLVLSLMMMLVLSLMGIASLNTTNIEMQISSNFKQEKQIFYGTESGCMRGGQWLKNLQLAQVEDYVKQSLLDQYVADDNFLASLPVRVVNEIDESNLGDATYPVKYKYQIEEEADALGARVACKPIAGNNPNILTCDYDVACSTPIASGGTRNLDVRIAKPTDFN